MGNAMQSSRFMFVSMLIVVHSVMGARVRSRAQGLDPPQLMKVTMDDYQSQIESADSGGSGDSYSYDDAEDYKRSHRSRQSKSKKKQKASPKRHEEESGDYDSEDDSGSNGYSDDSYDEPKHDAKKTRKQSKKSGHKDDDSSDQDLDGKLHQIVHKAQQVSDNAEKMAHLNGDAALWKEIKDYVGENVAGTDMRMLRMAKQLESLQTQVNELNERANHNNDVTNANLVGLRSGLVKVQQVLQKQMRRRRSDDDFGDEREFGIDDDEYYYAGRGGYYDDYGPAPAPMFEPMKLSPLSSTPQRDPSPRHTFGYEGDDRFKAVPSATPDANLNTLDTALVGLQALVKDRKLDHPPEAQAMQDKMDGTNPPPIGAVMDQVSSLVGQLDGILKRRL